LLAAGGDYTIPKVKKFPDFTGKTQKAGAQHKAPAGLQPGEILYFRFIFREQPISSSGGSYGARRYSCE